MALLFKNITHFYNVQLPMGNDNCVILFLHKFTKNQLLKRIFCEIF